MKASSTRSSRRNDPAPHLRGARCRREAESPAQDQPWLGDAGRTLAEARIARAHVSPEPSGARAGHGRGANRERPAAAPRRVARREKDGDAQALDEFVSPGMLAALRGTLRSSSAQAASLTGAAALATLNKSQIDVALAELGSVGDASVIVLIALSEAPRRGSDDLADSLGQLGPLLRPLVEICWARSCSPTLSTTRWSTSKTRRCSPRPPSRQRRAIVTRSRRRTLPWRAACSDGPSSAINPRYWSAVGFEASCRELAEANADVSCKKLWKRSTTRSARKSSATGRKCRIR